MNDKPTIRFDTYLQRFTRDSLLITDKQAREIWDAVSGDWTQSAFNEMKKRVIAEKPLANPAPKI